ncbi:hypothetical protein OG349_17345 [Streptomyces sp. NBC_01317]|uniref:hypothetical protein n=1 Tax=Streptomyces sp. NBC_01317 TaxID=2903822 RepID=UPI002E0EB49A|nr:hypothetical protein OG349_17345 [Streptomyces sp. NBC_01317]
MIAAEALVAGVDTPALCDLAGWPRGANTRDLREAFERALAEAGIDLPDPGLARRHALRRLAARLVGGEVAPADVATDEWAAADGRGATDIENAGTAEERAFVSLIPQCACCTGYTVGLDRRTWDAELRLAALALTSSAPIGPGC